MAGAELQKSIHSIVKAQTDRHTSRLSFVCPSSFSCPPPRPSSCVGSLSFSPGSAGGFKEQPLHCPVWVEQGGRDGSLSQHQKGSLPRDLQPAGVRAPTGGWGPVLQHMAKTTNFQGVTGCLGGFFPVCFQCVRMAGGVASSTGTGRCPQTTSGTECSTSQRSKEDIVPQKDKSVTTWGENVFSSLSLCFSSFSWLFSPSLH